ncbi:MAG: DUF4352 domain-containing protein, partial [Acidimicrobiales bacterium]
MSDASPGPGWWQASDGKWYPPQTAPSVPPPSGYFQPAPGGSFQPAPGGSFQPGPAIVPKKGHGCLYAILGAVGIVAVIVIIVIVAAVSATKKLSENVVNGNLGGPAPAAAYKVGDSAMTSGWKVTVFGFTDPLTPPSQYDTPQAGDHYVSVDVQITNPSNKQEPFSSLIAFHLVDSLNHQYEIAIIPELAPGAPDGQIAAGQSIRGQVGFQVPDG